MGPQNVIAGDEFPTELPERQVDDTSFAQLQKTARFSKTAEFKELKEHLEGRMAFYKTYMPDGTPVAAERDMVKAGRMWVVANCIIGEMKAIIDVYELAAERVKDELTKRKTA